jgi:hypothetical protein
MLDSNARLRNKRGRINSREAHKKYTHIDFPKLIFRKEVAVILF